MPQRASNTTTQAVVFIAVVGAVIAGTLALVGYPSDRAAVVARNPQPKPLARTVHDPVPAQTEEQRVTLAAPVAAVATPHVPRTIGERPKQTVARRSTEDSRRSWPPRVAVLDTAERASRQTTAAQPTNAAAVASSTTPDAGSQPITISGCLEATVDGDEFRLTDTQGADAPKARGWRSGFLTKRSAPVQLAELSDPAGLRQYVGHRVVVTGLLTDRRLRVRSLQAAVTSCD